jgi:hypothetical protein
MTTGEAPGERSSARHEELDVGGDLSVAHLEQIHQLGGCHGAGDLGVNRIMYWLSLNVLTRIDSQGPDLDDAVGCDGNRLASKRATTIAKLREPSPDYTSFRSSESAASVRSCSLATCWNRDVIVDFTDIGSIAWRALAGRILSELLSSQRRTDARGGSAPATAHGRRPCGHGKRALTPLRALIRQALACIMPSEQS